MNEAAGDWADTLQGCQIVTAKPFITIIAIIALHQMHEMLTIVTDVRAVCQSICHMA